MYDQFGKIHRNHWKKRGKSFKIASFEGDTSQASVKGVLSGGHDGFRRRSKIYLFPNRARFRSCWYLRKIKQSVHDAILICEGKGGGLEPSKNDNPSISYIPDSKNLSFLDDMSRMIADYR